MPHRLRVEWYERWSAALEDASRLLPPIASCPPDLFRLLAERRGTMRKSIALVLERGEPVAILPLRRRYEVHESVCDGIVPDAFAMMQPGRWDAALALGRLVKVNEWAGEAPAAAKQREIKPRYRVACDTDFDALWKDHHNAESVARARNRCVKDGGFEFEVDAPGAAEWIVRGWQERWAGDRFGEAQIADDIVEAARFLSHAGRYHAFRLLHRGAPVAGLTMLAHDGTLYFMNSHRDEGYDRFGVGTRLFELFFRWTGGSPYRTVDMGSGAYKERWASEDGSVVSFMLAPAHLRLAFRALEGARGLARRLRGDSGDE